MCIWTDAGRNRNGHFPVGKGGGADGCMDLMGKTVAPQQHASASCLGESLASVNVGNRPVGQMPKEQLCPPLV